MSPETSHDSAALMKRSLLEVRRLKGRVEELERAANEPIAIIGMGCRFPGGADNPENFWKFLLRGEDAITEVPRGRWDVAAYYDPDPTAPGKIYVREGGFLDQIEAFDAQLFGITPREAICLDPQQRLLLEVAWEALESACQAPDALYGANGGVFVGIGSFEYAAHLVRTVGTAEIDPHFGTGTALSAAAGRLSFTFGLTGPSMAIDTACSSSLVAVHLACQSLRNRECDFALAGGVNVMLAPEVNIAFAKARLLSVDGRCRTFDAAADGYGRGEGCGLIVLKRLSDAVAHGDTIVALIRGSAVNQDGPSGALVVPNGVAQQAVVRKALDGAGAAPHEVDYIEAHGTGTSLGDPIEIGALAQVFGNSRDARRPLVIGSVKTNFGHLESAAGIAGLIKTALSLQRDTLPAHLHFKQPNPRISWDLIKIDIPTEAKPWRRSERRRLAGVSSFGFTGTNSHVILEEAPARAAVPPEADRSAHVLTLSAKSAQALHDLAARFEAYAAMTDAAIGDICFSANIGRARLRHRLAIVAGSTAELRQRLTDFLAGRHALGVFRSEDSKRARPKTAFLFTPPGFEYPEMGMELRDTHPGFRDSIAKSELTLGALQTALVGLWKSWGVHPAAVWPEDAAAPRSNQLAVAADAIRTLYRSGCTQFIEIGPHPVLLGVAQECLAGADITCIPSLRRGESDWRQIAEALALFSLQDKPIDWLAFDRPYHRQRIALPLYPFQRKRFWFDAAPSVDADVPADVCYRVAWQPKPIEPDVATRGSGQWVIVSAGDEVGSALARALEAEHEECVVVSSEAATRSDIVEHVVRARGVVYLGALKEQAGLDPEMNGACAGALALLQALASKSFPEPPRVWFVTRGARAVTAGIDLAGLTQATLWGLGGVAAVELPHLRCTLIDLDPLEGVSETARQLLGELRHDATAESVAFRGGERYVARLTRAEMPDPKPLVLKSDGRYLVSGGLGGIGLRLARWLVSAGARRLILLGRSEASEEARATIEELRGLGADVLVMRADVARIEDLETLPALTGVIHCAGTFHDRMLHNHQWNLFEEVFAPKVLGSWNLHTRTRGMDLDFFVLFSSAASMLPSPGMAAYAAANAFQDALAQHRHSCGLPALSISWGPWADVGMAHRAGRSRLNQWRTHGMQLLAPARAVDIFGRLLSNEGGHIGVFHVDWPQLTKLFAGVRIPAYLEHVARAVTQEPASDTFEKLHAMRPPERAAFLETYLKGHIVRLLGRDAGDLTDITSLPEAGVDSLMIMDVLNALRNDLRFVLYPREFYQQPTIRGLAAYLAAEFERSHGQQSTTTATREPLPPIALILSSPRAGSTLLRVMLAGHPRLFSPPELHLLPFATMGERARRLANTHLGEGLQRALMALTGADIEASRAQIQEWERQDLPIEDVYAALQGRAGNRLLIDKSPTHAATAEGLARAERQFREAKYIHLVRHPYAVIESFVRMRFDKLAGIDAQNPYRLAEDVWTISNRNVLETIRVAAPDRYLRVYYEELVRDPRTVLTCCCDFLGVPFDEAVLDPYSDGRMIDGIHGISAPIGDPNFLTHAGIDARLGETWNEIDLGHRLGGSAKVIAADLGYDLPRDRDDELERRAITESFVKTPRGLRLCLCSWGPADGPLVLLLHGVLSQGAAWTPLAEALADKGMRVVAPDLRGHGRSDHVAGGGYHAIDFVADVDALTRALGAESFILVGHSMGAAIAALFAAARPAAVSALVLIEPVLPTERHDEADAVDAWLARQLDHFAHPASHPILADVETAAFRMRRAVPGLDPALALMLAARDTVSAGDGVTWRWDPLLRKRAGLFFGFEPSTPSRYRELLQRLRASVTIVAGSEGATRANMASFLDEAARSGATVVRLEGGHHLHLEKPLALADILATATVRSTSGALS